VYNNFSEGIKYMYKRLFLASLKGNQGLQPKNKKDYSPTGITPTPTPVPVPVLLLTVFIRLYSSATKAAKVIGLCAAGTLRASKRFCSSKERS
jgi:hypothetical protein